MKYVVKSVSTREALKLCAHLDAQTFDSAESAAAAVATALGWRGFCLSLWFAVDGGDTCRVYETEQDRDGDPNGISGAPRIQCAG